MKTRSKVDDGRDALIPDERIERSILQIRGQKVLLDKDLAGLYSIETSNLNKAVKRNPDRFPADFMFQLTRDEFDTLIFHFGTSKKGGTRKLPYAFTELGVAMLSSVLNSKRAVQVNIQIMRTFVALRALLATHKDLARKIDDMERKYDSQFKTVFEAIRQLLAPPDKPKRPIGFRIREPQARYCTRKEIKRKP